MSYLDRLRWGMLENDCLVVTFTGKLQRFERDVLAEEIELLAPVHDDDYEQRIK